MYPKILSLYGPVAINSYGLMIVLGFAAFLYYAVRHPRREAIATRDQFYNILFWGLALGIIGGRVLFAIMSPAAFGHWYEVLLPWEGGFSLLGTIIAITGGLPFVIQWASVPILPMLDLIAIYAPLTQAISRVGCFLAGCCYGTTCSSWFAVRYSHPESLAPLGVFLHPAQLYAAASSLLIFFLMRFLFDTRATRAGQLIFLYLMLESFARFINDFWRGDRHIGSALFHVPLLGRLSTYQFIAIGLFFGAFLGFLVTSRSKKP